MVAADAAMGQGLRRLVVGRLAMSGALVAICVVGLLVRLAFAQVSPLHPDETDSLLAAQGVAASAVPIFPSGALYVHGATLSYLLAPLVWLGRDGLDDLFLLRALSAVGSVAAIALTYRLAWVVTASRAVALMAGAVMALDPISVLWGSRLRMYGLEQALVLVVVLLFLQAQGVSASATGSGHAAGRRRALAALVAAFWLAVLTHLSVALLWPGMAAAAVVPWPGWRRPIDRGLATALALCLPAPLAVIAASTIWGATGGSGAGADATRAPWSFVGDQHIQWPRFAAPNLTPWIDLYEKGVGRGVMPWLTIGVTLLLVGHVVRSRQGRRGQDQVQYRWDAVSAVMLLYWIPVVLYGFVAEGPWARYLMFIQPLGAVMLAAAAGLLWRLEWRWIGRTAAAALALVLLVSPLDGLRVHAAEERAVGNPLQAMQFVAAHRAQGEPILTGWPPHMAALLGDSEDVHFLIGEDWMVGRYTRPAGGHTTDMWFDKEAIASVADLCAFLDRHPGSWVVWNTADTSLAAKQRFAVLKGTADLVFSSEQPPRAVYHSLEPSQWKRRALQRCANAGWDTPLKAWEQGDRDPQRVRGQGQGNDRGRQRAALE